MPSNRNAGVGVNEYMFIRFTINKIQCLEHVPHATDQKTLILQHLDRAAFCLVFLTEQTNFMQWTQTNIIWPKGKRMLRFLIHADPL